MAPVFELFPLEVGEAVGLGEVLPVGPGVRVEEEPMSAPGGISGVSKIFRFGAVHEKRSGESLPPVENDLVGSQLFSS